MHKANTIAQAVGHDFKASKGWFYHWQKRYGISFTVLKAEESNEARDVNEDLILSSPPAGLTKKQFENWLSIDDGAVVAPEIITEEENLDKIIHDIRQFEKETKEKEDGNSKNDVDGRVPEPPAPAEMRHCLTQLESGLESFDFSDMNLFRTLKGKMNVELWTKCPAKQTTLNKVFIQ
ncbi:---NA--- [Octopus vulgaris]|uniref:---NA n=1 Tax=Octopus vulgaris TaxID=6645 RepID=A0AA36B9G1_OCTVU|nr:---NA--- [Octopus vulgaris]